MRFCNSGMKWGRVKNGGVLTLIEREHFEVFITGDKNAGTGNADDQGSSVHFVLDSVRD